MADLVIQNIGRIISGDLDQPFVEGDTLVIRNGRISEIGHRERLAAASNERVVDAGGCMVWPGLINSHTHPVLGDFTPASRC